MDNFTKYKSPTNPIELQCNRQSAQKMILYVPLVTGGAIPNNVKAYLYSQRVRTHTRQ